MTTSQELLEMSNLIFYCKKSRFLAIFKFSLKLCHKIPSVIDRSWKTFQVLESGSVGFSLNPSSIEESGFKNSIFPQLIPLSPCSERETGIF